MTRLHDVRVLRAGVVGLVVGAALLTGCSGDDTGPSIESSRSASSAATSGAPTSTGASTSGTTSAAPETPSLPVPDGVTLTGQGSQLKVGDTATVAYQPNQKEVGVLDIKVTRLEKTSFKKSFVGWNLDAQQRKANPYFVRATVTNRGTTDLGGRRVPLYIVDGTNALVEPTSFASSFVPCQPGSFPASFAPGAKAKVCLVYLAPNKGDLTAVSFRPDQDYDPITWTGTLQKPQKAKKKS